MPLLEDLVSGAQRRFINEFCEMLLNCRQSIHGVRLDSVVSLGVIYLTVWSCPCMASYGQIESSGPQTPDAPQPGRPQPASRESRRPTLLHGGLLRCEGSRPGQVRDGPTCRGRRTVCQRFRQGVRLFASGLLPGSGCLESRGHLSADAKEAWPSSTAQVRRAGSGVPPTRANRRSVARFTGARAPSAPALRHRRALAQHRASLVAEEKKTDLTACATVTSTGKDQTAAYEQLRSCVLAGSSTGNQTGLVLLWRRGVAGWILDSWSYSKRSPRTAHTDLIATQSASNHVQAELVRVLANMAMRN